VSRVGGQPWRHEHASPSRPRRGHRRPAFLASAVLAHAEGISRRETGDGAFDVAGIVCAVQETVVSTSEDPLPDDAAIVVPAVGPGR
jgi:hypothetical protein